MEAGIVVFFEMFSNFNSSRDRGRRSSWHFQAHPFYNILQRVKNLHSKEGELAEHPPRHNTPGHAHVSPLIFRARLQTFPLCLQLGTRVCHVPTGIGFRKRNRRALTGDRARGGGWGTGFMNEETGGVDFFASRMELYTKKITELKNVSKIRTVYHCFNTTELKKAFLKFVQL